MAFNIYASSLFFYLSFHGFWIDCINYLGYLAILPVVVAECAVVESFSGITLIFGFQILSETFYSPEKLLSPAPYQDNGEA
ncbi:MAG: hypothetical protein OXF08_02890 [Bacteroidetes bacterium]|nr:hypothetical protein [Bacteroidota bacterium]